MSRQDKTITEKHSKTLRELLKRPENKLCADCKRNDPRWASWNLGVFLCIRCSGIHRGMGTHISKVKSVDLDVWTPEQMMSIQNWGNRRANLYWEAHLKAGHVPPDHKMESFVRSKYETRRWAMDGPPPQDPSVLEDGPASAAPVSAAVQQPSAPTSAARSTHVANNSLSSRRPASPVVQPAITTRQPQAHQLLSAAVAERNQKARIPPPAGSPVVPQQPQNDMFTLDFHSPPPMPDQPKKDVKQDILSLFSTPAAPGPASIGFGSATAQQSPWAADLGNAQHRVAPITSMIGSNGTGAWGASSGWDAGAVVAPPQANMWGGPSGQQAPQQHPQANVWGQQQPVSQPQTQQHPAAFGTADLWGSSNPQAISKGGDLFSNAFTSAPPKKDDVFGDLWGGFK
jgi:stromal membrane-associated protein